MRTPNTASYIPMYQSKSSKLILYIYIYSHTHAFKNNIYRCVRVPMWAVYNTAQFLIVSDRVPVNGHVSISSAVRLLTAAAATTTNSWQSISHYRVCVCVSVYYYIWFCAYIYIYIMYIRHKRQIGGGGGGGGDDDYNTIVKRDRTSDRPRARTWRDRYDYLLFRLLLVRSYVCVCVCYTRFRFLHRCEYLATYNTKWI